MTDDQSASTDTAVTLRLSGPSASKGGTSREVVKARSVHSAEVPSKTSQITKSCPDKAGSNDKARAGGRARSKGSARVAIGYKIELHKQRLPNVLNLLDQSNLYV